jgi:hypothetical protein
MATTPTRSTVPGREPGRPEQVLVLACGALAREVKDLVRLHGLGHVTVECLPADLHNRPDRIPAAVEARLAAASGRYRSVLVGYADCGTGGGIDVVCRRWGATRLAGDHCYELFAGSEAFAQLHQEEPGTFYLTDFLARNFETLVIQGLGIDRHPELLPLYFGNYRRLVHLAQRDDPTTSHRARQAADRLGLTYHHRSTGYGQLGRAMEALRPGRVPAATPVTLAGAGALTETRSPVAAATGAGP